jgi:hypothetical protein
MFHGGQKRRAVACGVQARQPELRAFGDHWDQRLGFLAAYIALILQFSAAVSRAGLIVVAPIAENLALDLRTASRKAWLAFSIRCQRSATRESLYWSPGSEKAEYSIPSIRGAVYDGSCISNDGAAGERIRFPVLAQGHRVAISFGGFLRASDRVEVTVPWLDRQLEPNKNRTFADFDFSAFKNRARLRGLKTSPYCAGALVHQSGELFEFLRSYVLCAIAATIEWHSLLRA